MECGKALGAGRSDRKFCDDVCRTAYNNTRRANSPAEPKLPDETGPEQLRAGQDMQKIKRVQDILLDNRIKLYNMFNLYESRLSLNDFYGFCINLKYFTSEYKDARYGHLMIFRMCFDYGYHIDGEQVYLIYAGGELHFN